LYYIFGGDFIGDGGDMANDGIYLPLLFIIPENHVHQQYHLYFFQGNACQKRLKSQLNSLVFFNNNPTSFILHPHHQFCRCQGFKISVVVKQ